MNVLKCFFVLSLLLPSAAFTACDDNCPPAWEEETWSWKGRLRAAALKNFDQFLNWGINPRKRTFPLASPLQERWIEADIPEVRQFAEQHGYFSPTLPLVSRVTTNEKDAEFVCCLLKTLYDKGIKGEYLEIAVAEVLTKALAYRDLKIGQKVPIPIEREGRVSYEIFTVDHVFDIWRGMPAFGLIPEKKGVASILLFRGTQFSFISERGLASIMSDLDIAGPGRSAFRRSQDQIAEWLKKTAKMNKKARVMGFSLGGTLAAYTFICENEWISDRGSIGMCLPGVACDVIEQWNRLSPEKQKGFLAYVNAGDFVSRIGKLFGTVYCLSVTRSLKPLTAHTLLMCSEPRFSVALVDVNQKGS